MSIARNVLVPILAAGAACEARMPASNHAVRDSAGVRIVESHAPAWGPEDVWRIDPVPDVSLGTVDGPTERSFARIVGAHRVPGGGLAVFDGGTHELRFFDARTDLVRTAGREGDGPGEFRSVQAMGVLGDSVWVFDGNVRRLTFVDSRTGGFRTAAVDARNLALGAAGALDDGSLVFVADLAYTQAVEDSLPAGLTRFGAAYLSVAPSGATLDTLLVLPGSERVLVYQPETIILRRPLFARSVSHAARRNEIVYGDQVRFELRAYGTDGRLRDVLRRTDVDLALDAEAYREAVETRVRAAPEQARAGLRSAYGSQPKPATRPAYGRLLVDAHDHLWVQGYAVDGDATTWSVFRDGVWLGAVELPPRFQPTQILSDEVVGIWRDELDVEYVRVHRLDRRGGTATDEEG